MVRYYNYKFIPTPVLHSSNQIFLNLLDIHITHLSTKLLHCYLKPYKIEKQVGPMSYCLKYEQ